MYADNDDNDAEKDDDGDPAPEEGRWVGRSVCVGGKVVGRVCCVRFDNGLLYPSTFHANVGDRILSPEPQE